MLSNIHDALVMLCIECVYRGILLFEAFFNWEYAE